MGEGQKISGFDFFEIDKKQDTKNKPPAKHLGKEEMLDLMVMAIALRDLSAIRNLIESGFKLPAVINGKKLSMLAVENFDRNVMDLLLDNGMKLTNISPLLTQTINSAGFEGLEYVLDKYTGEIQSFAWEKALKSAIKKQDDKCIELIINKKGFNFGLVSDVVKSDVFGVGVKTENENLVIKSSLSGRGDLISKSLRRMSIDYKQCQFLQKMMDKDNVFAKAFKDNFPATCYFYLNAHYLKERIKDAHLVIDNKKHPLIFKQGYQVKNFMDLLIFDGQEVVGDILKTKNGVEIVREKLKDPQLLFPFIASSSREVKSMALAKIPFLRSLKDDKGNNIAHYMLSVDQTQSMADILLKDYSDLLFESNEKGESPVHYLSKDKQVKISKKSMASEVKQSKKTSDTKTYRKKSKSLI